MSSIPSGESKVCLPAKSESADAFIDPQFGRASYFLFFNGKGEFIKSIENKGSQAKRGAGVEAAQTVVDEKAEAVIVGNIGPKASMALSGSGIKIYTAPSEIKAQDAFREYLEGKLGEVENAAA